jgi:hypothetical protein
MKEAISPKGESASDGVRELTIFNQATNFE